MLKSFALLFAIFTTLFVPSLSRATVIFTLGNNPQPGEENVLLNGGTTGSTVSGTLNQSGLTVNFSSIIQTLTLPANGQARVEATSNGSQVALRDVSFSLANGGTFTDAIFNPAVVGTVGAAGPATIIVIANDSFGNPEGASLFNYDLGNGNNFLTITTAGGETINSISIAASNGFTDLRQVRISDASLPTGTVPETGATLPLLGLGLLGLAVIRRRFLVLNS